MLTFIEDLLAPLHLSDLKTPSKQYPSGVDYEIFDNKPGSKWGMSSPFVQNGIVSAPGQLKPFADDSIQMQTFMITDRNRIPGVSLSWILRARPSNIDHNLDRYREEFVTQVLLLVMNVVLLVSCCMGVVCHRHMKVKQRIQREHDQKELQMKDAELVESAHAQQLHAKEHEIICARMNAEAAIAQEMHINEMQHKQARQIQASTNAKLLRQELERLKTQLGATMIQLTEIQPKTEPLSLVHRSPMVGKAWQALDTPWEPGGKHDMDTSPKVPCLALLSTDGKHFTASLFTKKGLGKERKLTRGSHAFVKVEGESHLRVSLMSFEFGKACGHPQLARELPVMYAGEVEFDENQTVTQWNNLSGSKP